MSHQPARGDDPEQALQGREGDRGGGDPGEAGALPALQAPFVSRRQAILAGGDGLSEALGVLRHLEDFALALEGALRGGGSGDGTAGRGERALEKAASSLADGLDLAGIEKAFGRGLYPARGRPLA
jgi:hypothetical protein